MGNIGFDEEIPLINQDEDYDDYKTPDARRIDIIYRTCYYRSNIDAKAETNYKLSNYKDT